MIRRGAKGAVKLVGGTTVVGVTGAVVYVNTQQGQGLRRELQFWSGVAPVVADYYWNFASSSPYVKYQKLLYGENISEEEQKKKRRELLNQLHQKHASKILGVLLDLTKQSGHSHMSSRYADPKPRSYKK